jgi:transcriptional regulator with XRE-family HTH domain
MPRVLSSLWHVETGKRLRRMREAKGLTQQAIGDVLECSFQMVQKYK